MASPRGGREAPAGLAGHLGEGVAGTGPSRAVDWAGWLATSPQSRPRPRRADQQAVDPGCGRGVQHRQHRVEDVVAVQQWRTPRSWRAGRSGRRPPGPAPAGRERLPVGPLDQVAGPREPRPRRPAVGDQVPADVVEVQVGEDHQVDLVQADAGRGQLLGQPPRGADPAGAGRPGAADPGVDQHDPPAGPDHEAPDGQPPAVGAVEGPGVAPPIRRPRGRVDTREGLSEGVGEAGGDVADGRDLDRPDGQGAGGHSPVWAGWTVTGTRWTALLA